MGKGDLSRNKFSFYKIRSIPEFHVHKTIQMKELTPEPP